jgi:tetraacyldisaccharide 4'-kinase
MRPPDFWQAGGNPWPGRLLAPLGAVYGAATVLRRWRATPYRAAVPVLVAGGLTLGGAGKTPLALALAERLAEHAPHFLSRGYGGSLAGPLRVDPARHGAEEVGDEPLLLAASRPTWMARDRAAGARAAVEGGAGLLILDDGFQNPTLAKDLAFVAIDGEGGIGNGRVFPAGPLREPIAAALARAGAVIRIGEDRTGIARLVGGRCPLLAARLQPASDSAALAGRRVLAFCGIARPAKFLASLSAVGAEIAASRAFPDHHPYSAAEIAGLLADAARLDALPVTTAKDRVRLPPDLRGRVQVLAVNLVFDDPATLNRLLCAHLPPPPAKAG